MQSLSKYSFTLSAVPILCMLVQKSSTICSGAYTQISVLTIADCIHLKELYPHILQRKGWEEGGGGKTIKFVLTDVFLNFRKKQGTSRSRQRERKEGKLNSLCIPDLLCLFLPVSCLLEMRDR